MLEFKPLINNNYTKSIRPKTNMNWSYISGFFDADGSITFISINPGKPKTCQISFHNNELNILENIKDFIYKELNIKGTISIKKAKKVNHNDAYDLKYTYLKKCNILKNYIVSNHPKKQIRLNSISTITELTKANGKYTAQELLHRTNFIEDILTQ